MIAKIMQQNAAVIQAQLMPDTVQVTPRQGDNRTVNSYGIVTQDAPVNRLYQASADIPCRIDTSSSYRPDGTPVQPTDVEEYSIEFPTDAPVIETDTLTINGKLYEIKKLTRASDWHLTITAMCMAVTV